MNRQTARLEPLPARRLDRTAERDAVGFARGGPHRGLLGIRRPLGHGGEPLPPAVRAWAETRVGLDLAGVRVHDDAEAHALAAERSARALTAGGDLLFGEGEYRPGTPTGRELLLHELVHARQQAEEDVRVTQHQPQPPRTEGIGRTPPEADFAVATLPLTEGEDTHVLFDHNQVELNAAVVARRATRVFADHAGAVVVSVHGYASTEGDPEYNVNLSAHRAVAVRDAITSVLPAGSAVHLIAHGATEAFGAPAQNRRVGLDVWDMPTESDVLDAERYLRRHPPLGFGLGLTLQPFTLPEPPPPRTPAEAATDATTRRSTGVLGGWTFGDPGETVISGPQPPPYLSPLPALTVGPLVPWGLLSEDFQTRGLTLGQGDQAVILHHWRLYLPLARVAYGIPLVSSFFDSPEDVMTSMTRKMISFSLAGDRPNAVEIFDLELGRLGIPTPIYTPSFELRFDADFRNWRLP